MINLKRLTCCIELLHKIPKVAEVLKFCLEINDTAMELPPGANAVVVPAAIHMNPKYFPDPQKFNPDRFLPEESVKRPVGAYIPFSSGPRGCLGDLHKFNRTFAIYSWCTLVL